MSDSTRNFVEKVKEIALSATTTPKMIHSLRSAGLDIMEGQDSSYLPMIQELCTDVFPRLNTKEIEHLRTKMIKRINISAYCTSPSGHSLHQDITRKPDHEFNRLRIILLSLMYGQESLVHKTVRGWINLHATELERFPSAQAEGMDKVVQLHRGTSTPNKRRASSKALVVATKKRATSDPKDDKPRRQKSATLDLDDLFVSDGSDASPKTPEIRRSVTAQVESDFFASSPTYVRQSEPARRPWKPDESSFRSKSGLTALQRIAADATRALPPLIPPQALTPSPEEGTFPDNQPSSSATVNARVSGDKDTGARASVRDYTESWKAQIQQQMSGMSGVLIDLIEERVNLETRQIKAEAAELRARLKSVEGDIAMYKRQLLSRSS